MLTQEIKCLKNLCEIGGAGNKCIHVALSRIDCYASDNLDKWDMCAGEVIVRALGGWVSDYNGYPLSYEESESVEVKSVIVCGSKEIYERVKSALP